MREDPPEEGVDDYTAYQSGEEDQCAVPALIDVGWIVENQEALDHGSGEPYASRKVGYPAKDSVPACDPTQEDGVLRRRKHPDPMVLPSGGGRH